MNKFIQCSMNKFAIELRRTRPVTQFADYFEKISKNFYNFHFKTIRDGQMKTENFNPTYLFGNLAISRHRFKLLFDSGTKVPYFPSLSLRGLLGWSLQETVCPFLRQKKFECKTCIVRDNCPYFCLYEKKSVFPGLSEAPKGYMLYSPPGQQGREIECELTLFGSCAKFLPSMREALFVSGKKGLGRSRNIFQITGWQELTPAEDTSLPLSAAAHKETSRPFSLSDWLNNSGPIRTVHFITPVRLRKKGKYISKMDWPFFFSSLARRLETINMLYGDGIGFGRENWLAAMEEFSAWEKPVSKMKWLDLARYSSRQQKKVPLGGLCGTIKIETNCPAQNLWWQIAELINVGKGAVLGLGRVETDIQGKQP